MAPSAIASVEPAAAIRACCAGLFASPQSLRQTLTHQIVHRFDIAPHEHEDVLQLDVILGCGGRAFSGGGWTPIHATTLLVSCPGEVHGYELLPGASPSRVFHLKIAATAAEELIDGGVFPCLQTGLDRPEDLAAAVQVVCRLNLVQSTQHPLMLARLAEALSLWPRHDAAGITDTATVAAQAADPAHSDLAAAVELIDRRLSDPPSLDEMAACVYYSTRHFARRFRALFGCTPHAYLTARRLEHARKLLLENRLKIHQIAEALGFSSAATFSRWFTQHTDVTPSTYREDPRVL